MRFIIMKRKNTRITPQYFSALIIIMINLDKRNEVK